MSKLKHSSFGIASFVLALVPIVFGILIFPNNAKIGKAIEAIETESVRVTLGWFVGLSYIFIWAIIPVLVIIFGVWGLMQKDRNTVFAKIALVIEIIFLFLAALFFFIL